MVAVGVTVMVTDALCNGGATPFPLRFTCKGTVDALDVMLRVPVRIPGAAGVKVRLTVQLAPAASELPHVLLCANSAVVVIAGKVSADVPVLVSSIELVAGAPPLVATPRFSVAADRLSGAGVSVANAKVSAESRTVAALLLVTVSVRRSLSPSAAPA